MNDGGLVVNEPTDGFIAGHCELSDEANWIEPDDPEFEIPAFDWSAVLRSSSFNGAMTIQSETATPVALTAPDDQADELGNKATFAIQRDAPPPWEPDSGLTVYYTISGSATAGSDYKTLSGSATFGPWIGSLTITVEALDDLEKESTETVTMTITPGEGYEPVSGYDMRTVYIQDREATVTITATDASAAESGTPPTNKGTFRVSRANGGTTLALPVSYTVAGSAAAGTDYEALSGTVTIPAGSSSATFDVKPVDDTEGEGSENVIVTLSEGSGYYLGTNTTATVNIADNEPPPPIVRVSASDNFAGEAGGGVNTGRFTFTRSGATTGSLSVSYNLASGTGYASPGGDYAALGTVRFSIGQSSVSADVTPTDDSTPEWTEAVKLDLVDTAAYNLSTNQVEQTAKVEIVDDDLGLELADDIIWVNNDDDDDNGVSDLNDVGTVPGEDDLVALTLDYPQDVKQGATVTLSAPNDKVRVWRQPERSGLALIDEQNGSVTWTIGNQSPPETVYVEAIAGSVYEDDVVLTLAASDAQAATPPVYPTSTQATTQGTNVGLGLQWNGQDVTGKVAGDVLIGQKISASVVVSGPWAATEIQWNIAGDTFKDYVADANSAVLTDLATDDLNDATVMFYWADAGDSPMKAVDVEVTLNGEQVTRNTKFNVMEPTSTLSAMQGTVGISAPMGVATKFGLLYDADSDHGMTFSGQVEVPEGFQEGVWHFVQLITHIGRWRIDDGVNEKDRWNGLAGLDGKYPYNPTPYDSDPSAPEHIPTGRSHTTVDHQIATGLDPVNGTITQVKLDETFETYIMFKPAGPDSNWVPLKAVSWSYDGQATKIAGQWTKDAGNQSNAPVEDTANHPQWERIKVAEDWISDT